MTGRRGGALYPVLLLLGVLVFLSAMIPQVLVQASVGIRQDRGRDALVLALESAVAFAEARLKADLSDGLLISDKPEIRPFTIKPTMDNPDFGKKKHHDWEARLLRTTVFDMVAPAKSSVKTFVYAYRVHARAWETRPNGRQNGVEVNGLLSVRVNVDRGQSGIEQRTIEGTSFESMAEERPNLMIGASALPDAAPPLSPLKGRY